MQCLYCKKEFEAKKPTAKYCSSYCRHKNFISNPDIKRGRKSIAEEVKQYVERVTDEVLIQLAQDKVYHQLNRKRLNYKKTKELALPVALKGITEKSRVTINIPKPIIELEPEDIRKEIEGEVKQIKEGFKELDVLHNISNSEDTKVKEESESGAGGHGGE